MANAPKAEDQKRDDVAKKTLATKPAPMKSAKAKPKRTAR